MSITKLTLAGEHVTLNHLPPEFAEPLFDRWIAHVKAKEGGIVGFDVETTAIDELLGPFEPEAKLRLVQFGSRKYAWSLDPHDGFWHVRIEALLNDPELRFVSHTNYDPLWAKREFDTPIDDRWIDTMPMACLLFPGVTARKGLKELCARFIDVKLAEAEVALIARFKELAPTGQRVGKKLKQWGFTNIPLDDLTFAEYAGLDAISVRRLLDVLSAKLRTRDGRQAKLSRREQTIQRLATSMRYKGLRVDAQWTANLMRDVETEYMEADDRLRELWGFSPLSPKRGDWLIDAGVRFLDVTPTGLPKLTMPSAAAPGTLIELAERYAEHAELGPVFADMVTIGSNKNFLSNLRIITESAKNDGLVHPEIVTQAAHTGRMSIKKPAMQTLKKRDPRLRGCFIARDGMVLVGADYASQEIRIAAAYSRDETLLRIVREDLNQHLETCKMIFGVSDKTTMRREGQSFYDCSKTLDFAQQYGAGPKRIAAQLDVSYAEAKGMWLAWREAYAGLVAWTESIGRADKIINPWGRIIPADPWRGYASGNYAVQGTGRDVLGDAIVRLADAGWAQALWLPVHDELILEVHEDEAELALKALQTYMPAKIKDIELPVTAEIIGKRWGVGE
jgi:DNA polymerase I-like protein with 3'-5' exonuclease and polymerase domains